MKPRYARRQHDVDPKVWAWLKDEAPCPVAVLIGRTERKLWEQYRDAVLVEWVQKRPGSRPRLWWQFEAPEPQRRRLDDTGTPFLSSGTRCGIPTGWPRGSAPLFESQPAYLDRLGLLIPGERARIPATAWEPETIA